MSDAYLFDIKNTSLSVSSNAFAIYNIALEHNIHIMMMPFLDTSKKHEKFLCSLRDANLYQLFATAGVLFEQLNGKTLCEIVVELCQREIETKTPIYQLYDVDYCSNILKINKIVCHTLKQYESRYSEFMLIAKKILEAKKIIQNAPIIYNNKNARQNVPVVPNNQSILRNVPVVPNNQNIHQNVPVVPNNRNILGVYPNAPSNNHYVRNPYSNALDQCAEDIMKQIEQVEKDEELARELQERFNNERREELAQANQPSLRFEN